MCQMLQEGKVVLGDDDNDIWFNMMLWLLLFVVQTCPPCCSQHRGGEQNVIVIAFLTNLSSITVWRDVGNDNNIFNKLMLLLCVLLIISV